MAQQQQQQPPQIDPQLPGPTLEELRDYKLGMERATAQFREQVQMTSRQAYIDLIHTLKLTSLKLITDLMDAEEEKVLQSIRRTKLLKFSLSKSHFQIINHIQKQKATKNTSKLQINITKPQISQDLKHLTLKIV